jgi:aryl-alcohol dehydrogenase-like predicted oxidoreductase
MQFTEFGRTGLTVSRMILGTGTFGKQTDEAQAHGLLDRAAQDEATPMATLSVAWILANPAVTSVILGASRIEQLTDTLAAADSKLASAVKTKLDDASIVYRTGDAGK